MKCMREGKVEESDDDDKFSSLGAYNLTENDASTTSTKYVIKLIL
jgi:hypothetical protein